MKHDPKRLAIFDLLTTDRYDIVFLQETHVTFQEESRFNREWKGQIFWANFNSREAGTAILFSENFTPTVSHILKDLNGRAITVIANDGNSTFALCNVYAPSGGVNKTARKDFFQNLKTILIDLNVNIDYYIIGGDFNCVLNDALDRSTAITYRDPSKQALKHLLSELSCEDIWRLHHPDEQTFTHRSHLGTASCIDRIYTPRQLRNSVISTDIQSCVHTDHDIISVHLLLDPVQFGKGIWHLNCSLLSDKTFAGQIHTFWAAWRDQKHTFPDLLRWWEEGKLKIQLLAVSFSKQKSRSVRKTIKHKKHQLRNIQRKADLTGNACHVRLASEIREHVRKLEEDLAAGAIIRSKAVHKEQNETFSKYFFTLEKKRGEDKTIKAVRNSHGTIISDPNFVHAEIRSFYKTLYTAEQCNPTVQQELLNNVDKHISTAQNDFLDRDFSRDELYKAISAMANGKSPGTVGLPAEFYKEFFDLLAEDLLEVLSAIFKIGQMSTSQRTGLITMLYKKGDRLDLKNWRPISLLNCDYKILSKLLSLRLAKVLGTIIESDETCSVPGRSITTNGLLLRDLIQISEENNIPAAFISLDQLKAFDRVDWDFLFKVMSSFNFSDRFIQWIRILYTDIQSCVKVNGHLTESFTLSRGVRQGCPLSPLLYTLIAEILAISIRKDVSIQGIPINSTTKNKISQYADDTTLTVVGDFSIARVFHIVTLYEQASGAKINLDKCVGLWIGANKHRTDQLHGISWRNDKIKIIGYFFGNCDIEHDQWDDKVEKFCKTLNLWKPRDLSLRGKALIINQLAASKLWYIATIYPLPEWANKQITAAIWNFFNRDKPQQVKRAVCELPRDQGGHAIININQKIKAIQATWIVKLLHAPGGNWKNCMLYNLNKYKDMSLGIDLLNARIYKPGLRIFRRFYRDILDTWFSLQGQRAHPPATRGDVLREPLFHNRHISHSITKLPLFSPEFIRAGLVRVSDIAYSVIPGFLPPLAVHELSHPHLTRERPIPYYPKSLLLSPLSGGPLSITTPPPQYPLTEILSLLSTP